MDRRKSNNKNDSLKLPSSGLPSKKIEFSVERKVLIQVIILLLITMLLIGCCAGKGTTQVYCRDGFHATNGWVSAETSSQLWVVDNESGTVMEFSKQQCSIKG